MLSENLKSHTGREIVHFLSSGLRYASFGACTHSYFPRTNNNQISITLLFNIPIYYSVISPLARVERTIICIESSA